MRKIGVRSGVADDAGARRLQPDAEGRGVARLRDPEWAGTSVLRSLDEVAALKQQDGERASIVHGSANLAQQLAAVDLLDRYHLLVLPILLSTGERLFVDGGAFAPLVVAERKVYGNGVVTLIYDVLH